MPVALREDAPSPSLAFAHALPDADAEGARLLAEAYFDAQAAAGLSLEETLGAILPTPSFFLARTTDESSREELAAFADPESPFGRSYADMASHFEDMDEEALRWDAVLQAAWHRFPAEDRKGKSARPPLLPAERFIPTARALRYNHQDALDIFFPTVKRRGAEEIGPSLKSISYGIVVAARSDWRGGDTEDEYLSGGLSPRSGNGLVVYAPDEGRIYSYFHMYDLNLRVGQLLEPGTVLGRGGNTGLNARKRGHGRHLHLEIFDIVRGESLDCYELRKLVIALK
jgi:murein DD-endopeptidase MepM/ murein hydrolase activator NlpD